MLDCSSGFHQVNARLAVLTHWTHSASGRGFPDVAAQGLNFQVVVGGKIYSVGGTSASSPVCLTHIWPHLLFADSDSLD